MLVAWLVARSLRRGVTTLVERVTKGSQLASSALQIIGLDDHGPVAMIDARQQSRTATVSAVARAAVSWFVWSIAVLLVLGLFRLDLAPLLAGAGIAGLAVGLGAQSLVRDTIAGFFMLLEDHCGVGDEVDLGHAVGTVEGLTLRMTSVRGTDGTLWSIPNGAIQRVGNRTRSWSAGFVDVTLANDADVDAAIGTIGEAIDEAALLPEMAPLLLEPPVVLGVERIDHLGTVVRVSVRTSPGQQGVVLREFRRTVKRHLAAASVPLSTATNRN
ncbi:MAG TPA: mechanosensitive ion channel protein MscS [Acidimicrobiaceae bacterium]|nr:mechanosensitive ion channel protein MscS [Acidimicrobiaceae bacterium]